MYVHFAFKNWVSIGWTLLLQYSNLESCKELRVYRTLPDSWFPGLFIGILSANGRIYLSEKHVKDAVAPYRITMATYH
jgi:hypothetical protein